MNKDVKFLGNNIEVSDVGIGKFIEGINVITDEVCSYIRSEKFYDVPSEYIYGTFESNGEKFIGIELQQFCLYFIRVIDEGTPYESTGLEIVVNADINEFDHAYELITPCGDDPISQDELLRIGAKEVSRRGLKINNTFVDEEDFVKEVIDKNTLGEDQTVTIQTFESSVPNELNTQLNIGNNVKIGDIQTGLFKRNIMTFDDVNDCLTDVAVPDGTKELFKFKLEETLYYGMEMEDYSYSEGEDVDGSELITTVTNLWLLDKTGNRQISIYTGGGSWNEYEYGTTITEIDPMPDVFLDGIPFENVIPLTTAGVKIGDNTITEDNIKSLNSIKSENCVTCSNNSSALGYNTVAGTKGYYYKLTTSTKDEDIITLPYHGDYIQDYNWAFPKEAIHADGTITPQCGGWSATFTLLERNILLTSDSVFESFCERSEYAGSDPDPQYAIWTSDGTVIPVIAGSSKTIPANTTITKITLSGSFDYTQFTLAKPRLITKVPTIAVSVYQDQACTIPADISTWQVGDHISLVNDYKYDDCATITSIEGNVIITTELPFSELVPDAGADADDYTITNINHPETGTVDLGYGSAAFGEDNKAINRSSFVAGRENEAMGQYSAVFGRTNKGTYGTFVAGRNNKAIEDYSVVMGQGCTSKATAGVAMGNGSSVDGAQAGIALGQSCKARACGAVALGSNVYTNYSDDTDASGDGSGHYRGQVVVGRYNANPSDNVFVVGAGTKKKALNAVEVKGTEAKINVPLTVKGNLSAGSSSATGTRATAIGSNSTASGNHSLAGGSNCTASGSASVSLGMNSEATNTTSVAAGHTALSTGISSIALGQNVEATRDYAFAGGKYSYAYGQGSLAFGYDSKATGTRAIAIGQACKSYNLGSAAIGANLTTSGSEELADEAARGQFVCGRYNATPDSDDIFVVGNGTSETGSNAFKVKSDGSVVIGNVTLTTEKLTKLIALLEHVVVDETTGDITLK